MKYLLDANALLALFFAHHEFHQRVERWVSSMQTKGSLYLATCPLTELAFVRISSASPIFGIDVQHAKSILVQFRRNKEVTVVFLPDSIATDRLPAWATKSKQTTDGYLKALADAHGFVLATLDEGIPGSFLIPR